MKSLVVVAHPDDETLGLGGILSGMDVMAYCGDRVQGRTTDGFFPALEILGCLGEQLDYPDQALEAVPLTELARNVERRMGEYDTIYTHWPHDLNADHRRVAEAVLLACRPSAWRGTIYAFATPSSTEWGVQPFTPTTFVAFDDAAMTRKLLAWKRYTTEQRDWPHPRNGVALAARGRYWASVACVTPYAEPLVLLREIR